MGRTGTRNDTQAINHSIGRLSHNHSVPNVCCLEGEDEKDPYLPEAAPFPIADNPYMNGKKEQYFIPSLDGLQSWLSAYMEDDELWRAICSIRTNVRTDSPLKSVAKI